MKYVSAFSNFSDPLIDFKMHHRFNDSIPGGERKGYPLFMYSSYIKQVLSSEMLKYEKDNHVDITYNLCVL